MSSGTEIATGICDGSFSSVTPFCCSTEGKSRQFYKSVVIYFLSLSFCIIRALTHNLSSTCRNQLWTELVNLIQVQQRYIFITFLEYFNLFWKYTWLWQCVRMITTLHIWKRMIPPNGAHVLEMNLVPLLCEI